jgi:hypothetical protein
LFSPVIFDDLNFDFVPYTPIGAYGQSKTADEPVLIRWRAVRVPIVVLARF